MSVDDMAIRVDGKEYLLVHNARGCAECDIGPLTCGMESMCEAIGDTACFKVVDVTWDKMFPVVMRWNGKRTCSIIIGEKEGIYVNTDNKVTHTDKLTDLTRDEWQYEHNKTLALRDIIRG